MKTKASTLFLIDGFGAGTSAFLLGVVLPSFQSYFGMPIPVLYVLAVFPVLFLLYDTMCILRPSMQKALHIRIIASANLCYCLLSIAMLFLHKEALSPLGWTYFTLEIAIVLLLAFWQLRVAQSLSRK